MKKIGLLALGLALSIGIVAEAGSIPTNRVPLHTYAIKKVNCYLQPGGTQKGWIDPGDYVIVEQLRSDGWAYGSYPVGKTRTRRWFRANDLVNNVGFANQDRYSPKSFTYVYRNPNHNQQMGSFSNNEDIVVVSDYGQSRQVIYKLSNGNGYKMGWVPYWDCWDARQAGKQEVNNNVINKNPIIVPAKREDTQQNNSLSCGCSTSYAGSYVVNTSRLPLTMRSGHGSNYSKIASIPKGATVTVSASNGTWAHVNYNGRDGYASMQYLKKSSQGISSGVIKGIEKAVSSNVTEQVKNKIYWMKSNLNGYKDGMRYTGSAQCRGFANNVYTYLFPNVQRISGYTNDNFGASSYIGSYKVGRISGFNSDDTNTVKNFFKSAKPGYFIQMGRRYSLNSSRNAAKPHSAILAGVYDDGCDFYEANADNKNTIKLNWYTWSALADKNKGYTLYAPNNYTLK